MPSVDQDRRNRSRLKNLLAEYKERIIDNLDQADKLGNMAEEVVEAAIEVILRGLK